MEYSVEVKETNSALFKTVKSFVTDEGETIAYREAGNLNEKHVICIHGLMRFLIRNFLHLRQLNHAVELEFPRHRA